MALGVDPIDLYQIQGFDPATPMEERLRALDDLEASEATEQQWLELAVLQKQASIWKILFMHSTRAPRCLKRATSDDVYYRRIAARVGRTARS